MSAALRAIDATQQGRGPGRYLFRDPRLRVLQAAETVGIRGILVHAIPRMPASSTSRLALSHRRWSR